MHVYDWENEKQMNFKVFLLPSTVLCCWFTVVYVCVFVCMHMGVVCVYVCMFVCLCVCVFCLYICMCVCVCIVCVLEWRECECTYAWMGWHIYEGIGLTCEMNSYCCQF